MSTITAQTQQTHQITARAPWPRQLRVVYAPVVELTGVYTLASSTPPATNALALEDDSGLFLLEDGSGVIELEA